MTDEILLIFVPIVDETEGEIKADALQFRGGFVRNFLVTGHAFDFAVVRFKGRKTAIGADVDGPFQIFRALAVQEFMIRIGFVDVKTFLNHGEKLVSGHLFVFLGFDDLGNVTAHGAFADDVAPTGMHAVSAFNAVERDGKPQLFGEKGDRGKHKFGLSAVRAVALGRERDRAALLGYAQTIFDGADIGRLLFDRNGRNEIADQGGYPALGENIFRCQIIDRTVEGRADEELVKGSLMIEKHQILSAVLLLELFRFHAVFPCGIRVNGTGKQVSDDLVARLQPGFVLFGLCFWRILLLFGLDFLLIGSFHIRLPPIVKIYIHIELYHKNTHLSIILQKFL